MQHVAATQSSVAVTKVGASSAGHEANDSNSSSDFAQIFQQNQNTQKTATANQDRRDSSYSSQERSQSEAHHSRRTEDSDRTQVDAKEQKQPVARDKADSQKADSATDSNAAVDKAEQQVTSDVNSTSENNAGEQSRQESEQIIVDAQGKEKEPSQEELQHNDWLAVLEQLDVLPQQPGDGDTTGVDTVTPDPSLVDIGQIAGLDPDELVNDIKVKPDTEDDGLVSILPIDHDTDAPTPDAPTPDAPTPDAPTPDAPTLDLDETLVDPYASNGGSLSFEQWKLEIREQIMSSGFVDSDVDKTGMMTGFDHMEHSEIQALLDENPDLRAMLQELLGGTETGDEISSADLEILASQEQELSDMENKSEQSDQELLLALLAESGKNNSGDSEINVVDTDVALEENSKQSELEQLLSQLDQQLQKPEDKLIVAENMVSRLQKMSTDLPENAKSFVDSLKSQISEFKDQLKSGREPGIDLQAMVQQAISQSGGNPENFEQQLNLALNQINQVTQLTQSLDLASRESVTTAMQSATSNRESFQAASLEASKAQVSVNQFSDKAINIAKPEAAPEIAKQVQVMVNQKNMVADIRLDPPDLGSMQIKVTMQGDSASVNIVVQSQQARDMLEQNTPKLRELLQEQGIELGQSSVEQEQNNQNGEDGQFAGEAGNEDMVDVLEDDEIKEVAVNEPEGIDYFA